MIAFYKDTNVYVDNIVGEDVKEKEVKERLVQHFKEKEKLKVKEQVKETQHVKEKLKRNVKKYKVLVV